MVDPGARQGQTCQGLPPETKLFTVPAGLCRILDRDLKAAGIPKRDDRGRTVDVHAMRTTLGTLLSRAGVASRTAQAAMRHSTIDLTMNVYTDPRLLDVQNAVEALPSLPLTGGVESVAIAVRRTGTADSAPSPLAPTLAPPPDKSSKAGSLPGKTSLAGDSGRAPWTLAVSAYPVNENDLLTTAVNRSHEVERKGLEPSTSALRTQRSPN
jgi:hypothetical protein